MFMVVNDVSVIMGRIIVMIKVDWRFIVSNRILMMSVMLIVIFVLIFVSLLIV